MNAISLTLANAILPILHPHRYVITELLQSDLHKIIVSPQHLSQDHIKVFLYQILRGLKYLHSARILHRDIKPGNLLVNSNCVLKICDFGLARVEEPDQSKHMTQEVVTQYYRAPEILMGARHYSAAVDVWSVGCIFGELLARRIIFQAQTPVQQVKNKRLIVKLCRWPCWFFILQLELITELLGTPSLEDMRYACEGARAHMLRQAQKMPTTVALYALSSHATHEAVHLLCQMLIFDPVSDWVSVDADGDSWLTNYCFRTSGYLLRMRWPIRTWMRVGCDITRACASAVSRHPRVCDNTWWTLSRLHPSRSTTTGSVSWRLFSK